MNMSVPFERLHVKKEEMKQFLVSHQELVQKQKEQHEIHMRNYPFETELHEIEREIQRTLQNMIQEMELAKTLSAEQVNDEVVQEMAAKGYMLNDQRKGKKRFRKRISGKLSKKRKMSCALPLKVGLQH